MKKKAAPTSAPVSNSPVSNLESIHRPSGDALKVYTLQNLLKNKRTFKKVDPDNLCQVVQKFYEKEIVKPAKKFGPVSDLWFQHAPAEFHGTTKITNFQRGTLTISVSSAALRAELEGLLRAGLFKKLQTASNGTIYRIKTSVQSQIRTVT